MRIRDALKHINLTDSTLHNIVFNRGRLSFVLDYADWAGAIAPHEAVAGPGTLTFYDTELVDAQPPLESPLWARAATHGEIISLHYARTLNANLLDGAECIVHLPRDGRDALVMTLGFRAAAVEWHPDA